MTYRPAGGLYRHDHHVPRRVGRVPGGPRPPAGRRGGPAPPDGGRGRGPPGLPPGGVVPEDYVFHGAGTDGAPIAIRPVRAVRPGPRLADHLQLHVPPRPGRRPARAHRGTGGARCPSWRPRARRAPPCSTSSTGPPTTWRPTPTWWRRPSPRSSGSWLRRGPGLAPPAGRVLVGHQLQPRLSRRVARGRPAADAQRLPQGRRHHPPLLGLGAALRPHRPGARTPPPGHRRAPVEPDRPHARGPRADWEEQYSYPEP